MTKHYLFQATPILIFNARRNKTTNEPIGHAKYYTNEDNTEFFTIKDKTTDKPYLTLDTQIIFQSEDHHYYIVHAQLPKTTTIVDDNGNTYSTTKNYLTDYTIKPMLQQQGGLYDAAKDTADKLKLQDPDKTLPINLLIIQAAIELQLQFTLEQTFYTTKDNQTKYDYRVVNTEYKR